jgi:TRAP-type mannitol/chloroaromatic compound transport system permease small subunit
MTRSSSLIRLMHGLDTFTEIIGRGLAWLNVAMVILTATVVVMRYLFNESSIFMQEGVMYLHATVFLLASAYTLRHNGHVRVDIFYQRLSVRGKAIVDLLGTLFLLMPVVLFIGLSSLDYVGRSWAILETSPETSGIPAVFLLKTLIPAMALQLFIQGVAEILRNVAILTGALTENKNPEPDPAEDIL